MPLALDEFVRRLTDSGLVAREELDALAAPLATAGDGAEKLARELVRQKKLTAYQAQQIHAGRGQGLFLGNYLVQDKLGQGGMGVVLKAEHRRMKRLVALKVLSPKVTNSPDAVKRFQREVEAAAKLIHPHIVTAFDADEANGIHFLVMEYVSGRDLAAMLERDGPPPLGCTLDYVRQAAEGLAFAHEHGVIHRDIKPANLLVSAKGVVKILDMGLARIDGLQPLKDGLTQSGQVMGTVDYMAPEQAFDVRHADARADIYSLGCTLYRLLTNENLYRGDSLVQTLMAHQNAPVPALRERRPDVAAEVDALYQRMVAKRPADRIQTMAEVAAELAALSTRTAVLEVTAPTAARSADFGTQPTAVVLTPSLVARKADGHAATISLAAPQQTTAPVPAKTIPAGEQPASAKNGRTRPFFFGGAIAIVVIAIGVGSWLLVGGTREPAPIVIPADGSVAQVTAEPSGEFVALLNQRDLTGWRVHPRYPGNWRVEDGVLIGTSDGISTLFTDQDDFEDFHLRVETRVADGSSGGVIGRALIPPAAGPRIYSPSAGYVAKINANNQVDGKRTGNLYVIQDGGDFSEGWGWSPSPVPAGEWLTLELIVRGSRIQILVNGRVTTDYTDGAHRHARGAIGLQAFQATQPIEFRKIEVQRLPRRATETPPAPFAAAPFTAEQAQAYQQAWADELGLPVEFANTLGQRFRLIPPGEFTQGLTDEQFAVEFDRQPTHEFWKAGFEASRPAHRARIMQPFYLAVCETTQQEFETVAGRNPSYFSLQGAGSDVVAGEDTANLPVEMTSFADAVEFCQKMRQREELAEDGYRLPSEAEWEYACRAGSADVWSRPTPGAAFEDYAWCVTNAGDRTHAVGTKAANAFGLYDVHGNVWEHCRDRFVADEYASRVKVAIDPLSAAKTGEHILRGGGAIAHAGLCTSYYRHRSAANKPLRNDGFRVLLPLTAARQVIERVRAK